MIYERRWYYVCNFIERHGTKNDFQEKIVFFCWVKNWIYWLVARQTAYMYKYLLTTITRKSKYLPTLPNIQVIQESNIGVQNAEHVPIYNVAVVAVVVIPRWNFILCWCWFWFAVKGFTFSFYILFQFESGKDWCLHLFAFDLQHDCLDWNLIHEKWKILFFIWMKEGKKFPIFRLINTHLKCSQCQKSKYHNQNVNKFGARLNSPIPIWFSSSIVIQVFSVLYPVSIWFIFQICCAFSILYQNIFVSANFYKYLYFRWTMNRP